MIVWVENLGVSGYKLGESFIREYSQHILGPGEGNSPLGFIFELGHEKPGKGVLLLGRQLGSFFEGFLKKTGHP